MFASKLLWRSETTEESGKCLRLLDEGDTEIGF